MHVLNTYTHRYESEAIDLPNLVRKIVLVQLSERQGQLMNGDLTGSMGGKKQEGYF